jgi:hypothetical protein
MSKATYPLKLPAILGLDPRSKAAAARLAKACPRA